MSGIFGPSFGPALPSFDFSALGDYYLAMAQLRATSAAAVQRREQSEPVSYAPWEARFQNTSSTARLRDALETTSFVDIRDSDFDKAGVSKDHKKLFALYKGLSRLQALATRAGEDSALSGERAGLDRRFRAGLAEIKSYLTDTGFEDLTLLFGARAQKIESALRIARPRTLYVAKSLVSGESSNVVQGLTGSETFTVSAAKAGSTINVAMDLSQVTGGLTLDNIIAYMNTQMQAAGLITRFNRQTFAGASEDAPNRYGLGIQTVATERISFSAASTEPALYVASAVGTAANRAGQLTKLSDAGASVATEFTQRIAPEDGTADVQVTATDSDGNVFVVGGVTGDLGSGIVQGDQDVYLRKYDSAGQLVWSRLLGSSDSASGYALAVDADGNVAIAGAASDKLTSTAVGGRQDTYVTKYDAQGREVFTRQIAPILDDSARALAFGADGSLYVAGQTKAAMSSGITHGGGTDAYLMKLTSSGSLDYVRQFGGTGEDRATGVAVDADGNVVLATVEAGEGKVRKLLSSDGTSAAVWEISLGAVGQGSLGPLAVEAGAVYVSGTTDNAALTAGGQASIAVAHSGGSDGFVVKIADAGASASASFISYLGTTGSDGAAGIAVRSGEIYLAGSTNGALNGGTAPGSVNGYVAKLDSAGARVWAHQFAGAGGTAAARSLALDAQGSSVLDTLGLPRGTLSFEETRLITARSSVRAGDYFYLKVNGNDPLKISVKADDTMSSLVTRVNGILLLKGEAEIARSGGDGLRITAKSDTVIELIRGSDGFDALAGLGLEPGKIYAGEGQAATSEALKDKNVFALGLDADFALSDATKAKVAANDLGAALDAIRNAYRALTRTAAGAGATAPADIQRQIANYQAALFTLG